MQDINIDSILNSFKNQNFANEDEVKIHAYSSIIEPIRKVYAPHVTFRSERRFAKGGRADATVGNIVIEYKRYDHFSNNSGINEALYGRNSKNNDSGLYQYIIGSIENDTVDDSILDVFGIGFDGKQWIVSRFMKSNSCHNIDLTRTKFESTQGPTKSLPYKFVYKIYNLREGIKEIVSLFNSMNKLKMNKDNLVSLFGPNKDYVSEAINNIYIIISDNYNKFAHDGSITRIMTLYNEWDRSFGAMFGEESQETEFNSTSSAIRELYNIDNTVDYKLFLFSTQTYFNIVLKMLINSFMKIVSDPTTDVGFNLTWSEIIEIFEGNETYNSKKVNNFFEIHYYEWFTYIGGDSASKKHQNMMQDVINNIQDNIKKLDLATFKLKPETVQDILQEIYMSLIPDNMRHLLGEYFSPDWIVEHALDRVGYMGDIKARLIDPTCGSGAFLIQALKRVVSKKEYNIGTEDIKNIVNNIVGFDLNPISAISAKANYILTLFSSIDEEILAKDLNITIPIYIADSVLSPVVYSEQKNELVVASTSVGDFEIPKFDTFSEASKFLDGVTESIANSRGYAIFSSMVLNKFNLTETQREAVRVMYENLTLLHRSAQDSFWGKILKNSFAPVLLKNKFDYVVGNPPWISWKSMSKVYRTGTLEVWKSYGIFEKNAYDKKTTHDDFGMAVTYVALDQYLANGGKLYFLLPWAFVKSTKGGHGFRKFKITRNNQDIPIKVSLVDDYNTLQIFKPKHTVRTIGMLLEKGVQNTYPMNMWYEWDYKAKKEIFGAHDTWDNVLGKIYNTQKVAKPIDSSDIQSSWATLSNEQIEIVDNILSHGETPCYRGRKGIEPAGAKGVYILKKPEPLGDNFVRIVNDMSRQRRKDIKNRGEHPGIIEDTYVYPMLGGRNIQRWKVISNEFMLVPHTPETPYGMSEIDLAKNATETYKWLEYYREGLDASRRQNGKFYDPKIHPWYRLDNVGEYTFSAYKVIWKEQAASSSAVAIGPYSTLPMSDLSIFGGQDKPVVVDSKILMVSTESMLEAYYLSGILNSPSVRDIIDTYGVGLNRGIDVLKNIMIPRYDSTNEIHQQVARLSEEIHALASQGDDISLHESNLDTIVLRMYLP